MKAAEDKAAELQGALDTAKADAEKAAKEAADKAAELETELTAATEKNDMFSQIISLITGSEEDEDGSKLTGLLEKLTEINPELSEKLTGWLATLTTDAAEEATEG